MWVSRVVEVNLGGKRLILQWLCRGAIAKRARVLFFLEVAVAPVVYPEARVFVGRAIPVHLHGAHAGASAVPACVANGRGVVVVERAHEVVIGNLIGLVIIGAHEDVFHRCLVGLDEVVGILRLQRVAQRLKLVHAIFHGLPAIALLAVYGYHDGLAFGRHCLAERLAGLGLLAHVVAHEHLVAVHTRVVYGEHGGVDGALGKAHVSHGLCHAAIVFTGVLAMASAEFRQSGVKFRGDEFENVAAVALLHVVCRLLRRCHDWHLSIEVHGVIIVDGAQGTQLRYVGLIVGMSGEHGCQLVDAGVAQADNLEQVVPHRGVDVDRRLKVVEEHVLPFAAVHPVALATREHGSIGYELLKGLYIVGAAI